MAGLAGRLSGEETRPVGVTVAGIVALVGSLAVGTSLLVALGLLVLDPGGFPEGLRIGAVRTLTVLALAWCVAAGALALGTLRGSPRSRSGLVVSAVLAGSASLTTSMFLAVAVLPMLACVTTIVLLLGAGARAWFRPERSG